MLLAELILKWAASPEMRGDGNYSLVANNPAAALSLAGDLARLMDDMTMRQVRWDRLDELVPQEFDEFWQKTLRFLKIAREHWPAMLKERGCIEPAERRDKLIAAEAKRLAGSKAPVIAAGSTGSIPATATLLDTIAKLPHGAVVLPGLDTELDAATWELLQRRAARRRTAIRSSPWQRCLRASASCARRWTRSAHRRRTAASGSRRRRCARPRRARCGASA